MAKRVLNRGKKVKSNKLKNQKAKTLTPLNKRIDAVWLKEKERQRILWDTGQLLGSLDANATTGKGGLNTKRRNPIGVTIGFSPSVKHSQGLSMAELVADHHFGVPKRRLPARTIFVMPDSNTTQLLTKAAEKFITQILKES